MRDSNLTPYTQRKSRILPPLSTRPRNERERPAAKKKLFDS